MARVLTEDDIAWIADRVVEAMSKKDLQKKSVGLGDPEKEASVAGKLNAEYATVDLTGLDLTNVDVPHNLGVIPTRCELLDWENAADATTELSLARSVDRHLWTASNCRVRLRVVAGTQAGTVARFQVGGK